MHRRVLLKLFLAVLIIEAVSLGYAIVYDGMLDSHVYWNYMPEGCTFPLYDIKTGELANSDKLLWIPEEYVPWYRIALHAIMPIAVNLGFVLFLVSLLLIVPLIIVTRKHLGRDLGFALAGLQGLSICLLMLYMEHFYD